MKVITLSNEKGGVGKSTMATHIATGLAIKGYRVVLVDADAQANATTSLGLKIRRDGGLYQLLVKDGEWKHLLQVPNREVWGATSDNGSLYLLDSNAETRVIPLMLSDVQALHKRLKELDKYVDVVVIDTAPTPSLLHAMIYVASDYVLFPSQAEMLSMTGLGRTIKHLTEIQNSRKGFGMKPTELLGVIPTMYQGHTVAHQHGLRKINQKFGHLTWKPIVQRTVWREAAFAQKMMFSYEPDGQAAAEMWQVVNNIIEGVAEHG